ncbi:SUZ RNA-binding domain-containing isoform X2 [Sminthopsis crassicaudata]|uniref:SUZ RNA-binding domain-containing isoform X2 n=1 Tax=Sminthopsis crassicaudata TaxID=9301 RepID=UPI003D6936AC
MEDEEVAESWEEAADSGLILQMRKPRQTGSDPPRATQGVRGWIWMQEDGSSECKPNTLSSLAPTSLHGETFRLTLSLIHLKRTRQKEIDRRLEKKLKITQKERKSTSPPKVPIVIQDDSLPSGPPPQIRILKRPTSNGVVSSPNSTSRPALPVKSLAQREAEYAEARKRILGSASPEEEQEKPILDRPTRISQPEDTRQPNNVIRQPLGPDGSQGFKQRR